MSPTGDRIHSQPLERSYPGETSLDASSENKRRATSTSARGIANLTPDRLAKKRANDREAQRAIRERTKNQIESLERKIRELTSQQPYQELQSVLRQKELVEAENADIKKRLATVLSLIQPVLGQHAFEVPQYASPVQPTYIPNRPSSSTPNSIPSPGTATSPPQWQTPNASMTSDPRGYAQAQTQQVIQPRQDMAQSLSIGPERLGLDFLLDPSQQINKMASSINGTPEMDFPSSSVSRGSDIGSPIHHRSNSMSSISTPHSNPTPEKTGHAAPIRNGPPTCPLDSLLLDFLHEKQQQAVDGVETPKLVGPAYPSVSSLLNPARSAYSHPLSKVFTDILATFPGLSTLPEKIAVLYIMFLIMRWQIAPTQENYDRLPHWVTPRPSQLFTPHPAWIDHLPFPKMRDRLVYDHNPRDYLFENFFIPFTTTLSLNWPYEPMDVLYNSPDSEELMINPVFERHLRRLDNWSLGPAFAKCFPRLADTYRLKMEGDGMV